MDQMRRLLSSVSVSGLASSSFGAHEAVILATDGQGAAARELVVEALSAIDPGIPLWKSEVLLTFAVVEAIAGDMERAAVLLAACRAHGRRYVAGFRTPMSYALYSHYLPIVRRSLSPEEAIAARDRGRAMTLDEAVDFALSGHVAN
jgi:hypothetical protein